MVRVASLCIGKGTVCATLFPGTLYVCATVGLYCVSACGSVELGACFVCVVCVTLCGAWDVWDVGVTLCVPALCVPWIGGGPT